jgi:hypothetical protein
MVQRLAMERRDDGVWRCGGVVLAVALCACDKAADAPADSGAAVTATASATASAAPSATTTSVPAPAVSMPPRPLPAGSTTVGSGATPEVQMKAIAYMMALQSPQENDPPADLAWATQLAGQLKPIVASLDKGSAADKAKLDGVEVLAGGRRVDLLMAAGCDAQMPSRAVAGRASTPLPTLLSHGVLVIRCNDNHWQCLQNTRNPDDVICTTAPRHK